MRHPKKKATFLRSFRPRLEALEDRTLLSTFVVTNLNDSGPGSLREAVQDADAAPDSTINFAAGLTGSVTLNSGPLNISSSMTINGPSASLLAISGNDFTRVFNVSGGNTVATINGLTITHGSAANEGGGIFSDAKTLNLSSDVLSNNVAIGRFGEEAQGGAIVNSFGQLNITDTVITDNQALGGTSRLGLSEGGGIYSQDGSVTLVNSTITDNQAIAGSGRSNPLPFAGLDFAEGGGLYDSFSAVTITGSTFSGNQAVGGDGGTASFNGIALGGAIANYGGVSISSSTFTANQAIGGNGGSSGHSLVEASVDGAFGGAIENDNRLFVSNSNFSSNLAQGGNNATVFSNDLDGGGFAQGGAIDNEESGIATFTASTFQSNQAIGGDGNSGTGGLNFVGSGLGGAISSTIGGGALFVPTLVIINGGTFDANEAIGGNNNSGSASVVSFVGTGLGGMIWNDEGSIARISDGTLEHNAALGGNGNTASGPGATFANTGAGGAIVNDLGNVFLSFLGGKVGPTIVSVTDSTIAHNQALGGTGGDALGGGLANLFNATAAVSGSTVSANLAIGGPNGGNAFGGGFYNDATSTLTLDNDTVTGNHANAGDGGEGIGGGIYNLGTLNLVGTTLIKNNHATTSNDDIYG